MCNARQKGLCLKCNLGFAIANLKTHLQSTFILQSTFCFAKDIKESQKEQKGLQSNEFIFIAAYITDIIAAF